MKTDFQASGHQFFPFSQTAVNTGGSSFSFNQNILETQKRGFYRFFCVQFYSEFFFCKCKLLFKLGGSQFFKDEPYSCQWTPFVSIFQRFFKVEAAFPYSGNLFLNILHLPGVETIIGIRRTLFREKELILASRQLFFWLVEIIFSPFCGDPCHFFRLVEKYFSRKSLFLASENGVQS